MAKRTAIRELQSRLAARLQSAQAEGAAVSWLAVRAAGRNYLFPLVQSGEIFPLAGLQRVPYCQPWFQGVVNLRGGLFGVVDLASFVGNENPSARPDNTLQNASVVTLHTALEVNCAFLVDGLAGLRGNDAFNHAEGPPVGSPPWFGNRYTDQAGAAWQEINLQTLSQDPQFLAIGI
jgi:twitching motility protein PilI